MQEGTSKSPGNLDETARFRGDAYAGNCPTRQLLDRIGDKWSVLILLLLGDGDLRFSELKRRIDGISRKMLSQTLRTLERDGLVIREIVPTRPPTVSYAITPLGRELLSALSSMMKWAETHMPDVEAAQRRYDAKPEHDQAKD